jgi:hypothetical protein
MLRSAGTRATLVVLLVSQFAVGGLLALERTVARADCRVLLIEESIFRDQLVDELERSRIESESTQQIFELLDGLWANQAVERLAWLAGKNDRDQTAIELRIHRALLDRQNARIARLELICGEASEGREDQLEALFREYEAAHCRVLAERVEAARAMVDYHREVLDSVRDLYENELAARQDIIRAERDLAISAGQFERASARHERFVPCREDKPADAPR